VDMGDLTTFVEWARRTRPAFYQLYTKLLPHEMSSEDGGGVTVIIQKFTDPEG